MTDERGAAVEVDGLVHEYRTQAGALRVLDRATFRVAAGEYVALLGQSGSGKSTMLSILGGLERPQAGVVRVAGLDLSGLDGDALAAYRRSTVGFVFQHYGLLETLTAVENVELAGAIAGSPRRHRRRRADDLLEAVGLTARADHRPAHLSGGERQRVAIARALVNDPRLLLADEPTGNLDTGAADTVVQVLEDAAHRLGCTVVLVTHNAALAERADRRLRLHAGAVHDEMDGP